MGSPRKRRRQIRAKPHAIYKCRLCGELETRLQADKLRRCDYHEAARAIGVLAPAMVAHSCNPCPESRRALKMMRAAAGAVVARCATNGLCDLIGVVYERKDDTGD